VRSIGIRAGPGWPIFVRISDVIRRTRKRDIVIPAGMEPFGLQDVMFWGDHQVRIGGACAGADRGVPSPMDAADHQIEQNKAS
jgi:hypothetical protein